ncbi:unnamed protein product [Pleuronectes platessa]|uniref:Uncharacterized protein n=1 Tax=Pleuronectes platessa TaxID=8262 RepID=A0A9N7TZV8_PLEPL|nr:unnamed protein product [Pleuronectes platessa]
MSRRSPLDPPLLSFFFFSVFPQRTEEVWEIKKSSILKNRKSSHVYILHEKKKCAGSSARSVRLLAALAQSLMLTFDLRLLTFPHASESDCLDCQSRRNVCLDGLTV